MKRTKKQKVRASKKRVDQKDKKKEVVVMEEKIEMREGFKNDLTKLIGLTILAVGMILALRYAWRL